ncbi:uncharacterized protein [Ptychodera flava]|uniref:uncharacterized protein n=1 Tax=Ptychodera flava TaxID=63121 RepID=UPI00396A2861
MPRCLISVSSNNKTPSRKLHIELSLISIARLHVVDFCVGADVQNTERCSWRPESKFCYPGSCPSTPDSCTCAPGFSGTNCLNTTLMPTISPCTVTLKDGSNNNNLACSVDNAPIYSSLKATVLAIHWKTSYDPVTLTDYPSPYYVNSSGFGIVEVTLAWNLKRGNITLKGGTEYCLTADILSTQIKTKQCNHSVVFNSELKHNDVLWFQVRSNTSGCININNYDDPYKVTLNGAQFYSQQRNFLSNFVVFDLIAPQHCRQRSPPCTSHLFSISEVYTKNSSVLVRMDPTLWQDDSGVNRISWEVYKETYDIQLTGNLQQRSQLNNIPTQDKPGSTIVVEFPEAGVYSIILTVFDNVGNAAKARRVVMYDDRSSISVSEDNPITISDAVVNNGVSWLGTKSGQITIIWARHFYNSFHRDNNLLAAIEEMDPPLPAEYDEPTGQPPLTRSREAIPNVEGITRFEFDYAISSSGKTKLDLKDMGQKTETILTVSSVDGDHVSVWLKAFDVMGNTREDLEKFYLDSSPPLITYLDYMYRTKIDSSVHVKRDNDNTVQMNIASEQLMSLLSFLARGASWRIPSNSRPDPFDATSEPSSNISQVTYPRPEESSNQLAT